MTEPPAAEPLDLPLDPEYAAISSSAVLGLIFSVLGVAAFVAEPLLVLPAAGFVLSLLGYGRVVRSEGAVTGRRLALAGIVLGGGLVLGAGGWHGYQAWSEMRVLDRLRERALALTDDLIAGRYDAVFARLPDDFRAQPGVSQEDFRRVMAPMFEGGGELEERALLALRPVPTERGTVVAPAEIRVKYATRALKVTVVYEFDGEDWRLLGVEATPTFGSLIGEPGA